MSILSHLLKRSAAPRDDLRPLWDAIVALARAPELYRNGGVADTVAGRFDMVSQTTALVLLRMEREAALIEPAARLTERFVADIEGQLREQGIGDPTLGKRMGDVMSALGGRIGALREGLSDGADEQTLTAAIERNVTFGERADADYVVAWIRALMVRLRATESAALLRGSIAA